MKILYFFLFLLTIQSYGQQISLYDQFNGNYDYTAIGATLNQDENNLTSNCTINTTATANLNLLPSQNIEAAYLYWAGSGNGDFTVKLNNIDINVDKTFSYNFISTDGNTYNFFAALSDKVSPYFVGM